jgi:hypothetical protein
MRRRLLHTAKRVINCIRNWYDLPPTDYYPQLEQTSMLCAIARAHSGDG